MATAAGAAAPVTPGESPYGPLGEPDANGVRLPEGFTSRIVAVAGDPVADTDYAWLAFPDGAACFAADDGGWMYVCNSEIPPQIVPEGGGVSAVRFATDGTISDAYRILEGSTTNCAGGPTPWGTWLSGEEVPDGRIWECDPTGTEPAVAHEAMGRFQHEAAAVDPAGKAVYLTEDNPEGVLYRFTPTAYPDLTAGLLEAATVADDGAVTWSEVADPSGASTPTRSQVPEAKKFAGGEGIWHHDGVIYFTTKLDHSVHMVDLAAQRHEVIWKGDPDGLGIEGAVLSHVDNITVDAGSGDLYVAEDGGNMELVLISTEGTVAPFAQVVDHPASEITGPCFNPARDRLYFSSQRGPSTRTVTDIVGGGDIDATLGGVTFEVTGPFRGIEAETEGSAAPTTTLANAAPEAASPAAGPTGSTDGGDDGAPVVPLAIGGVMVAAAAGGVVAWRRRTGTTA